MTSVDVLCIIFTETYKPKNIGIKVMNLESKKRIRLADIAEKVGTSKTVVARVLLGTGGDKIWVGEKKSRLIRDIAREMNYCPNHIARQLRGAGSKTISVLFDMPAETNEIAHTYINLLLLLEREAAKHDLRIMIGRSGGKPEITEKYLYDFQSRGIEYVFWHADYISESETIKRALSRFKKIVFYGQNIPKTTGAFPYIVQDKADGFRQAAKYLKKRGRSRIAMAVHGYVHKLLFTGPQNAGRTNFIKQELVKVCPDSGLPSQQKLSPEKAGEIVNELVLGKGADAIICSNDFWALSIINALRRIGKRVPEDVAIIGYDNMDFAGEVSPSLTTLDQQHELLSKNAINFFVNDQQETINSDEKLVIIKPRLIIGESA